MTSAHDPFSQSFDSIEVDPARAPSAQALEHAFAFVAPRDLDQPGFHLIDDAGGRFVIDRDMGVVSLRDAGLLDRERFAIHTARVRVVENSGESYEMELKLRLTGPVPQMLGAEDALFDIPVDDAPRVAPVIEASAPQPIPPAPQTTAPASLHWTTYAAARARAGKTELARTRRAFIASELPSFAPPHAGAVLSVEAPLPPVGLGSRWSI